MKNLKYLITSIFAVILLTYLFYPEKFTLNQFKNYQEKQPQILNLDLDLTINDKTVQHSKIITTIGHKASAGQLIDNHNGTFIEVSPIKKEANKVAMQLKMGKIINRQKFTLAETNTISKLGQQKKVIEVCDKDNNHILLSVTTNISSY